MAELKDKSRSWRLPYAINNNPNFRFYSYQVQCMHIIQSTLTSQSKWLSPFESSLGHQALFLFPSQETEVTIPSVQPHLRQSVCLHQTFLPRQVKETSTFPVTCLPVLFFTLSCGTTLSIGKVPAEHSESPKPPSKSHKNTQTVASFHKKVQPLFLPTKLIGFC